MCRGNHTRSWSAGSGSMGTIRTVMRSLQDGSVSVYSYVKINSGKKSVMLRSGFEKAKKTNVNADDVAVIFSNLRDSTSVSAHGYGDIVG